MVGGPPSQVDEQMIGDLLTVGEAHLPVMLRATSPSCSVGSSEKVTRNDRSRRPTRPLRANIDETVLPVIITEQGENRNRCEEQRNLFGFSYGLACRGT
jgi:hypothetical protein